MIEKKKISNTQAKNLLNLICQRNDKSIDPHHLAVDCGFEAADVINLHSLHHICDTCVNDPKNVNQLRKYIGGNNGLLKYFLGEIMRETKGKFKPKDVESSLIEILKKKR